MIYFGIIHARISVGIILSEQKCSIINASCISHDLDKSKEKIQILKSDIVCSWVSTVCLDAAQGM